MRIGSLEFEAPVCAAELSAAAIWWTSEYWPSACTPSPLHPHLETSCVCVAVCVVASTFYASAVEDASFSCVWAPSFPPLAIRAGAVGLRDAPPQPHSARPGC